MSEPVLRFATANDMEKFYGEPMQRSMRAIVVVVDGEPAGVAGTYLEAGHAVVFSDLKPAVRPYKKAMLRAGHMIMEMVRADGVPAAALASPDEPSAPAFLSRLGFKHFASTENGEVYVCPAWAAQ